VSHFGGGGALSRVGLGGMGWGRNECRCGTIHRMGVKNRVMLIDVSLNGAVNSRKNGKKDLGTP